MTNAWWSWGAARPTAPAMSGPPGSAATGPEWSPSPSSTRTWTRPFSPAPACAIPVPSREKTSRIRELAGLDSASADIIVSNSVLEHVRDPLDLFRECLRVLAPGGIMLHQVDYRDHFFKYPFHFLTFSKALWDNLLDPGDLPRLRLDDHLLALRISGFECEVLKQETDPAALAAVVPFLAPEFSWRDRDMLSTTTAALACRRTP